MWYTVLFVVSASGGNLDSLSVSQSYLPLDVCQEYATTHNSIPGLGTVPGYRSGYTCMELPKLEALIAKYDCAIVGTDPNDNDLLYQCKSKARAPTLLTTPALPATAVDSSSNAQEKPEIVPYPTAKGWAVQAGSYLSIRMAQQTADALLKSGHQAFVMPVHSGNATLYRVRVGPFTERAAVSIALSSIKDFIPGAAIVAHP